MKNLSAFMFCLLGLIVGCSSVTDSGFSKQELRDIRAAVAQCTTNETHLMTIQSPDRVELTTVTGESYTVARTTNGWKVSDKKVGHIVVPEQYRQ